MSLALRIARPDDLEALLAIRGALSLERAEEGGFLLGSAPRAYATMLSADLVRAATRDGAVIGFCAALPDPIMRASELWERRAQIAWRDGFDPAPIEARPLAYLDQLAVLPAYQRDFVGAALALWTLCALFAQGHAHVFATTLIAPAENRAALPLLAKAGAERVGVLEEFYEEFGPVRSAIHCIERARAEAALARIERESAGEVRAVFARIQALLERRRDARRPHS